jgi:hypothetical protein
MKRCAHYSLVKWILLNTLGKTLTKKNILKRQFELHCLISSETFVISLDDKQFRKY